jgi:hypothetical protein
MGVVQYIDKPSTAIAKKERKSKEKAKGNTKESSQSKAKKTTSSVLTGSSENRQKKTTRRVSQNKSKVNSSSSRDEQALKDAEKIDLEDLLGKQQATPDQLTNIREQSEKAVTLARRMANGEDLLKTLKKEYQRLVSDVIPNAMKSAQLNSFELVDGSYISIKNLIKGSIPKNPEKRKKALDYLKKIKGAWLLKGQISIPLMKGENVKAKRAINAFLKISKTKKNMKILTELGMKEEQLTLLKDLLCRVNIEDTVHHQSLCAFARELAENGEDVDFEKLGLFAGPIANIDWDK